MKIQRNQERGSVLVTTLVISGLMAIVVSALLVLVERQNYFTARSKTWCAEIPIAEAGVEEAMAHLNSRQKLTSNGWTKVANNYVKTRTVGEGYFYSAISTSMPPTIVSIGYGRIPLQTNYTHRTVMVMTKQNPSVYGVVAKGVIKGGTIDSFDSSNPAYSTGGQYDPAKRTDRAGVGTYSSAIPAITGTIYGVASTGPGGTAEGTIGDGSWVSTTTGVQPGHLREDFNMAIPDVSLPTNATWVAFPSLTRILGNRDYKLSGGLSSGFIVTGKARLWITGNVKLTGGDTIIISAGASLEIYLGGSDADFGGNGIVNVSSTASACRIWGLPTLTDMKFSGNAALTAVIYAPQADVKLGGTPDLYGAITANTISAGGNTGIHYDEALGTTTGPAYTIVSWEEL